MRCRDAPRLLLFPLAGGVAVAGLPCTLARGVVRWGCARVCLSVRALPCAWRVAARVAARLLGDYYLSDAPCPVACCWFVAVSFVCRLLNVVRFVSAPASGVTWFMSVCVGVRLTATVIVAYYLLCNDASSGLHCPRVCPSFS